MADSSSFARITFCELQIFEKFEYVYLAIIDRLISSLFKKRKKNLFTNSGDKAMICFRELSKLTAILRG